MRLRREQMRVVFRAIVAGDYEPGERLPSEEDLQRQLGVSRGVVREALRALEERGVVVVRHGSGQIVTEPSNWNVLDRELFPELVESRGGETLVAEVTECRLIVEVEVARLAATRATAAGHQRLGAAMEALRAAPARAERGRGLAELEFHRVLVAAAKNVPLVALLEPVLVASESVAASLGRRRSSVEEHEAIVEAIGAGDGPRAAEAMRAHLEALLADVSSQPRRASAR